jgi:hypothetical protein
MGITLLAFWDLFIPNIIEDSLPATRITALRIGT